MRRKLKVHLSLGDKIACGTKRTRLVILANPMNKFMLAPKAQRCKRCQDKFFSLLAEEVENETL